MDKTHHRRQPQSGFTLIELLIVFTLIGILVGLAIPQYKTALIKSREATLKENLYVMRNLINQYYTDKMKYPDSLQALVDEGYLYKIPEDPITQSSESWVEVREILADEDLFSGRAPGIVDVNSGSDENSLEGTPYSTW